MSVFRDVLRPLVIAECLCKLKDSFSPNVWSPSGSKH